MATDVGRLSSFIAQILAVGAANSLPMNGMNFGPAPRGKSGSTGRNWVYEENKNEQRPDRISNMGAIVDLADRMKSDPIDFDAGVVYIPGEAQNNAGLVRTPENLASFVRQSMEEHRHDLEQFKDKPEFAANPEKAIQLGIKAEEGDPKWWNDKEPRRPVTPTSSCVKKARIGANGDIYITFGSDPSKEYQYEGSSDPVRASEILRDLVASESIGRNVNSWSGSWGKAHTYLPKG